MLTKAASFAICLNLQSTLNMIAKHARSMLRQLYAASTWKHKEMPWRDVIFFQIYVSSNFPLSNILWTTKTLIANKYRAAENRRSIICKNHVFLRFNIVPAFSCIFMLPIAITKPTHTRWQAVKAWGRGFWCWCVEVEFGSRRGKEWHRHVSGTQFMSLEGQSWFRNEHFNIASATARKVIYLDFFLSCMTPTHGE